METKVIVGWFSTSKKSADRRWSSRPAVPVSIVLRSTDTLTVEAVMSSAVTMVPSKPVNLPRTLPMRWRTVKPISVWVVSSAQVPVVMAEAVLVMSLLEKYGC